MHRSKEHCQAVQQFRSMSSDRGHESSLVVAMQWIVGLALPLVWAQLLLAASCGCSTCRDAQLCGSAAMAHWAQRRHLLCLMASPAGSVVCCRAWRQHVAHVVHQQVVPPRRAPAHDLQQRERMASSSAGTAGLARACCSSRSCRPVPLQQGRRTAGSFEAGVKGVQANGYTRNTQLGALSKSNGNRAAPPCPTLSSCCPPQHHWPYH